MIGSGQGNIIKECLVTRAKKNYEERGQDKKNDYNTQGLEAYTTDSREILLKNITIEKIFYYVRRFYLYQDIRLSYFTGIKKYMYVTDCNCNVF